MFLLSLLLSAAAPAVLPQAEVPMVSGTTRKAVAEFGECFLAAQHREGRPGWVVLQENGAKLSNDGVKGVGNPYRIRLTRQGSGSHVELFANPQARAEVQSAADGVKACM